MGMQYDYSRDQQASPVLAFMIGLGVLAAIAFLGLIGLRVVGANAPYSPPSGSASSAYVASEAEFPVGAVLPSCPRGLSDEACYAVHERKALGGDLTSQLFLMRHHLPEAFSAWDDYPSVTLKPGAPDALEAFAWAAFASCTFNADEAMLSINAPVLCPSDYALAAVSTGGFASASDYTQCSCGANYSARQCENAVFRMRELAMTRRDMLSFGLNDAEIEKARQIVETRLRGLGAYGHVLIGDMHRKQCLFERSDVRALAHYQVGRDMGSNLAADRYREVFSSLTAADRNEAQRLTRQLVPGMMLKDERQARISELRADEIPDREIQWALKALGLYTGPIDGKIGPRTGEAIERFKRCENIAPFNQSSSGLTNVKIIERAAMGGLDEKGRLNASCYRILSPHARSLHLLGMMHMEGIGVPQDFDKSRRYLTDAAERNFYPAIAGLAILSYHYMGNRGETEEQRDIRLRQACSYLSIAEARYAQDNLPFLDEYSFLLQDLEQLTRSEFRRACTDIGLGQ